MSRKTTKIVNKSSETNDIIDPKVEEIIKNLVGTKKAGKREMFWTYRIFGIPPKTAASLAGYAESYAHKLDHLCRKDTLVRQKLSRFLSDMPDHYRDICRARLPQISQIESNALAEYGEDSRLAIEKPALLKAMKGSAGVIQGDEDRPAPITINVDTIERVQVSITDVLKKGLENSKDTDTK